MTLHIANVTFDCDDPKAVAEFWSAALSRPVADGASRYFATIPVGDGIDPGTPALLFLKVPEAKTAKNRCHVDLHVASRDDVQPEVDRLVDLGATVIRTPKEEFGTYWATLQDPEGNELCIGAP